MVEHFGFDKTSQVIEQADLLLGKHIREWGGQFVVPIPQVEGIVLKIMKNLLLFKNI
ncbi:hypothetical protein PN499_16320 [Kamptonema animale CS-326]|jgi:hypothetical protein|uniref:hypothetical protein n=1 Tax=Kamptonema animale TaxID=92934 RepID=UPI00232FE9CC|nr:hypothetical protein [Kamptonema animale]MDB9512755.1 hypothetical protein [Kamptonema animale CS-326]